MIFEYEITAADVSLAQSLATTTCRDEVQQAGSLRIIRAALIISVAVLFGLIAAFFRKYQNTDLASTLSWGLWPGLASIGLFLAYMSEYKKRFTEWREAKLGPFPIPQTLLVTSEGLLVESKFGQVQYRWCAIQTLTTMSEYFVFTTASASVVLIPFRAFPTLEERNNFEEEVRSHIVSKS